jgi:integron integrase
MEPRPKKLLDQVRDTIRLKHYSYRTEESYVQWIRRYILFHDKRHPLEMGSAEIEAFLTDLAVNQQVAASTQNQALSALLFLYRAVLKQELDMSIDAVRAKRSRYLPTVLTREEVLAVIQNLPGVHQLFVQVLYGSGLRLTEGLQLRVKDMDFAQRQTLVRDGKGKESRVTMLPSSLIDPLKYQLEKAKAIHQQDLDRGLGSVYLPFALERKYPQADRQWIWQCIFPSDRFSQDPRSGVTRRHHLHETGIQRSIKLAVQLAGIQKRVGCHTFRHSFATSI